MTNGYKEGGDATALSCCGPVPSALLSGVAACRDCGRLVSAYGGTVLECCFYSPVVCTRCFYTPCDGSCREAEDAPVSEPT